MRWTCFSHDAALVLGGMGSGLILAYVGGILLWGGFCLTLVILALVQAWRADTRAEYSHAAGDD